jgi:formate-dependent nitrite reductase membrane component NrfD
MISDKQNLYKLAFEFNWMKKLVPILLAFTMGLFCIESAMAVCFTAAQIENANNMAKQDQALAEKLDTAAAIAEAAAVTAFFAALAFPPLAAAAALAEEAASLAKGLAVAAGVAAVAAIATAAFEAANPCCPNG